MNENLEAKNSIQFRLTDTASARSAERDRAHGNLLVSFYYLDTVNQQAVDWHIASLLVEEKLGAGVLYEGNLANNTVHVTAIHNLQWRIERSVNCVRIERVK